MGLKNALQDLLKNLSREGGYFLTYVEKLVHRKKDSKQTETNEQIYSYVFSLSFKKRHCSCH